jgi:tetratricopeptide (TPR) repeat protein
MMKLKLFSLLAAVALLVPVSMRAQAPAAPAATEASVHGHVNNAAGMAITKGQVKLTTDKSAPAKERKYKNSFDLDSNGDYKGTGVAPGDYLAIVSVGGVDADYQEVVFKAGEDKPVNFDMTRKEFIDAMSPEDRKALEEYKKNASAALKANSVITNLNNALKTVHEDLASANPNYDNDVKTMQDATAQKPDEPVLWYNLGGAQVADADAKVRAARAAKTSWQSDESITKLYNDAIDSYKKGIAANDASKKPSPPDAAIAWDTIGNSNAKLGKVPEAQEAFDNAVKLAPASAGRSYSNEAVVLLNANQNDAAAVAADKAIAADPTRADAYYVKGQALVGKATVDAKGAIVAPPGCIEAYQKYLELAPDGPHAADVKDILTGMGQTISTKYKAPGKTPAKK